MLLNQQDLAKAFNVTTRTIRSWHSEGCSIHSQEVHCTLYNLPDVLEFVVKKRVGNELTHEKTRLTSAMATKTELETKQLLQELLQTNLVNFTWGMFRQDLEEKVRAMPEQLTEELLQQKTLVDCKTQLKEILRSKPG